MKAVGLVALLAMASAAGAQEVDTNVQGEAVKGGAAVFGLAKKVHATNQAIVGGIMKRRDACVGLASAGKLGEGTKGNGAFAQYRCIVAGTGKAADAQPPAAAANKRP